MDTAPATTEILPGRPRRLRLGFVNAYLWTGPDGSCTLVDTGSPGDGPALATALRGFGGDPPPLRRVVLTHGHEDHAGGAAELAGALPDVEVAAHRLDAPIIRGERACEPPRLWTWEVPLRAATPRQPGRVPAGPRRPRTGGRCCRGPRRHRGRVVSVPGHTEGSIALYLPDERVLFTGDLAAHVDGRVLPGAFHTDPERALASFRTLAGLDVETACFGHGEPIAGGAGAALRAAAH